MGKHNSDEKKKKKHKKDKKKKKEKKCKKVKKERIEEDSSSSSSSDDNVDIVWTENVSNVAHVDETKLKPETKSSTHEKQYDSGSSGGDDQHSATNNNAEDDWLGLIQQSAHGNVKQAHIKRAQAREEQEKADNKIRYARELNSYYRDDVNKKFLDDPDEYWKQNKQQQPQQQKDKSKFKEYSSSSGDDSNNDDDDDGSDDDSCDKGPPPLTDAERNAINAKIIKAEMLGDKALVAELKAKLESHGAREKKSTSTSNTNQEVQYVKRKSHQQSTSTEEENKMSVKEMYFRTKSITARDEAMRFVASSAKLRTNGDEYEEIRQKNRKKAKLLDNKSFVQSLRHRDDDNQRCGDCLEQIGKHLSLKSPSQDDNSWQHCFVSFTPYEPFIDNYCQIRSKTHLHPASSLSGDEECWRELRQVMRLLASFYEKTYKCVVIFMETHFTQQKRVENLSRRHFVIECVPIKQKWEADARIYFHKAIMECEQEWSMNRKLVKLDGQPPTAKIPKTLPYFWVSFGGNFTNGFAHVIEDEDYFRKDFGKEIIGGLRDIEPRRWKRPKMERYDEQMHRVGEIKNRWNDFIAHL